MRSVWREHRAVRALTWCFEFGQQVTAEEAVRLEHMRQMLAAEQGSFCSSFDDPALIRHLGLGSEHMAREFDAAAKFHAWRNRAELADVYAERAAKVRGNCRNEF